MVTAKDDHKFNYILLQFLCSICVLPFRFDSKNAKMVLDIPKWKQWFWYILYVNSTVCVAYQVFRLFWVFFGHDGDLNYQHLASHLVFATGDPMMVLSGYTLFIQYPEVTAAVFNDVAGFMGGQREYTQRAKYIRTMAFTQVTIEIAMIATYLFMAESPQFYYSILPANFQNIIGFVVMMVYESGTNVVTLSCFFMALFIQVCFFNTMSRRLRQWTTDLQNVNLPTFDRVTEGCERCRRAQRDVARFNQVFAYLILAFKLLCITVSTAEFSFSIIHYTDHPILSILCTFYGIQAMGMYITFYDDGYHIFERVEEMKRLIRIEANRGDGRLDKKSVNVLLRSIPPLGIQVGRFYYMEQASTFIFCDFVINQVVSVVVGMESV